MRKSYILFFLSHRCLSFGSRGARGRREARFCEVSGGYSLARPLLGGIATILRQELAALAEGHSSISKRSTAKSEEDNAWHAGYRDGLFEASRLTRKIHEQQTKEQPQKRADK